MPCALWSVCTAKSLRTNVPEQGDSVPVCAGLHLPNIEQTCEARQYSVVLERSRLSVPIRLLFFPPYLDS